MFAALGDPVRLAMVRRLCDSGPLTTAVLRDAAGGHVSRQGITKHLQVLEAAGLLESTRRGRDRHWRLRTARIVTMRQMLDAISARWDDRLASLRTLVEERGDR